MEIPYDGGDNTPARHHILLNKTIVQGMGYIVLNHLPKGPPKTLQVIANAVYSSSQPESKNLLLKTPCTRASNLEKSNWYSVGSLT